MENPTRRRRQLLAARIACAAVVACACLPAGAQVTTASLGGLVLDAATDEPLVGATVVATHQPSGTEYGTTTDVDGRYILPYVRVGGPYGVTVSYVGYEAVTKDGFSLQLGQRQTVDFAVSEGALELEGAEVVANRAAVIDRDRTGAATAIDEAQLRKLPTISRSAQDFTRLTPQSDGNSFGGRNDQFNSFTVDGSIFTNPFGLDAATPGGQAGAQPISLDALDQITVNLSPYDVTLAGFTGAAVNAVTKSGTNDFHGTAFGFFRNQDLTGGTVNGEDVFVPDLTQTQAGFSIGGPIVENKVFFFVNAEVDQREDLGSNFVASRPGVTGANVSRVTAADLDAVALKLRDIGYSPGEYEGYLFDRNSVKALAKLDINLGGGNTLTATYNYLDAFQDKNAHPNAIATRGPDATTLQFESSGYRINNVLHSGIVELRSIINSTMSNKLQVGLSAFRDSRDPRSSPAPSLIVQDGSFGNYIVLGHEPFSINNRLDQDVLQITNNFNYYLGAHTLTAGVNFERFAFDNSFNLNAYGGTFGGPFGAPPGVNLFSVGGFLNTDNDSLRMAFEAAESVAAERENGSGGYEDSGWALAETNVGQLGIYLQDEWATTDRLNLTFGLRVDVPLYFDTDEKLQESIDRNCCHDGTVDWYNEDGSRSRRDYLSLPERTPLFSPRFGFNLDVTGDQTTQLRGGTGLFTGRLPFVWIGNQVANPNTFFYNQTASDFKFPQVWRTNVGFDQRFGAGWTVTTDVIFTRDLQAPYVRRISNGIPSAQLAGQADNRPFYLNDVDKLPAFPANPNFEGYEFANTDVGYTFNASVQVQRQFANDLYLMAAYNFLDAQDATSIEAEISSDAWSRNPANLANSNVPLAAPSLYGNRHRFIASALKTWEYGDQNAWATTVSTFCSYAQGGTTLDDFTSDFRYSYTYSGDINNDGSPLNDLLYIPTESELDAQVAAGQWASPEQAAAFEAFIEQDDYLSDNRGNYAERYAALAPWFSQWDVRIAQDFRFGSTASAQSLQFTLDILNFGNLLNSNWGVRELPTNAQPVGVDVGEDLVPNYRFDPGLRNSFTPNPSLLSRWQGRVGLRYSF